ncbi:hypothetical protein QBC42DRAFT_313354 [Cladorrhinum samala]|uniref:UBC core domain-containing protein n=1 Tax=Cladorrhinum samala TaxID=585594 RepID=A0AAV9HH62_9PEZI|nr:hypothetical protein QBC42DRAFT_313354 [Cladorrhinum samala]
MEKFKTDLATARQKVESGSIRWLKTIQRGDCDGEVVLVFDHKSLPETICIHALAESVSEYPEANKFMLYIENDNPPEQAALAVSEAADFMLGFSIYEMAMQIASSLNGRLNPASPDTSDSDFSLDLQDNPDADDDDDDDDDDFELDDYGYDDDDIFGLSVAGSKNATLLSQASASPHVLQRIRRDLRGVHNAGYKLGILDNFAKTATSGVFSISVRVDALGLSDAALEAWDLDESEYVVLLIRTASYLPFEHTISKLPSASRLQFRIGKCLKHKPSLQQALLAFDAGSEPEAQGDQFQKLFLSNSLDQFMNEYFISLVKLRESKSCSWEHANEIVQNSNLGSDGLYEPTAVAEATEQQRLHQFLESDHVLQKDRDRSLPLIAMQFAMRYFIRCTEYCLRCHRKLEERFEALRPYVCSNPLCLFQYMSMGFGPNIEHEILTEPYVVDLLVSLCYAAVHPCQPLYQLQPGPANIPSALPIRDLPVGLRLNVPDLNCDTPARFCGQLQGNRLMWHENVAELETIMAPSKWIAFRVANHGRILHGRILGFNPDTKTASVNILATSGTMLSLLGSVVPGAVSGAATVEPAAPTTAADLAKANVAVEIFPYDVDFDSLDTLAKGKAMQHVLDTLPPILEIEQWLNDNPQGSLKGMESVSPAAVGLLQWIVSSNRSCIFQVDRSRAVANLRGQNQSRPAGRGRNREHERVVGMPGWIQFRFAQGSPDKELRFNRALQEVAKQRKLAHPTIFAWHGSMLNNWHSIVRNGLDYKDIRCGRAYGNGVYFSPNYTTSVGYSGSKFGRCWPKSNLNFISCLSLNEIINAPDQFVSKDPHYVVAQPDWHQCRYLFIQPVPEARGPAMEEASKLPKGSFHSLAQGFEPLGSTGHSLKIPLSAIPTRTVSLGSEPPSILVKRTISEQQSDADGEDAEDVAIVFEAVEMESGGNTASPPPAKKLMVEKSKTDFVPGSLDFSTLARLNPPSFANESALKALGKELKNLQAVQTKAPLHELGWYVDFDQVTNLFQWIVELHSFDPALPLANDMKVNGITSIVSEIRFPKDYPFSPPFVRIIRPRFLPFMHGGGGHVTLGGAMCMQLLTTSGWSPANSLESVLLQVRMALCSCDPKPARLVPVNKKTSAEGGSRMGLDDYGIGEALDAYIRAADKHGWAVPEGVRTTAAGV